MNPSCGCLILCFLFLLLFFYIILCHLSTLWNFNSCEIDYLSRIRFPPGGGVYQFYYFSLFFLSTIINYFLIFWRERTVSFRTVSYDASRIRMFIDGCRVLPFVQRMAILALVLVVSNWIGAGVSSAIWLMPFEYVWMGDTHACVILFMLGGLRGGRIFLVLLSLMMFPYDTLNYFRVSNRTYFTFWGWNLEVPYFSIHLAFKIL